jgi:hypothetical protein
MKNRIYHAAGLAGSITLLACGIALAQSAKDTSHSRPPRFRQASNLPDLSGLAWLGGNQFLAVHDAKVEGELANPRVSLIELPVNSKGLRWQQRTVHFHELRSNDLESAARIPGTLDVLLVESGDSLDDPAFQRIFKARVVGNSVQIVATAQWPVAINNIEASAVAALGARFVFLFAERAQNLASTELRWALFDPDTLSFGSFSSVTFPNPNAAAFNRPLVGMDVDSAGQIYIVAAFDAEAAGLPDPDNGPFASGVYRIGVVTEGGGVPAVRLFDSPLLEGMMDGFKVESVAIREDAEHGFQIFIGLDDENSGATLRLLPEPPKTVLWD